MSLTDDDLHLAWMARYFGKPDYLPLSTNDLAALSNATSPVNFEEGDKIYRQGDSSTSAYLLESGPVELRRGHGDALRCLCKVRPGAMLGDAEMFLEEPYLATAAVLGRVRTVRFDRRAVLVEMANQPNIGLRWLFAAMRQIYECHRRVSRLLRKSVIMRVADLIVEEHEYEGEILFTQEEMARLLGVTRSAVNRAIGELRRLGVVTSGYRTLTVSDVERLKSIAGEI